MLRSWTGRQTGTFCKFTAVASDHSASLTFADYSTDSHSGGGVKAHPDFQAVPRKQYPGRFKVCSKTIQLHSAVSRFCSKAAERQQEALHKE